MKTAAMMKALGELQTPRLDRWLLAAVLDWSAIVAAMVISHRLNHWAAYVAAVIVIGAAQHALSQLGHEGTHHLLSRTRALNDVLPNVLCWWPLLVSGYEYRKAHLAHHRYLGTPQDPERIHRMQRAPSLPITGTQVALDCLRNVLGFNFLQAMRLYRIIGPKRAADIFGILAIWGAFIGIVCATHTYWVLALWVVSFPTTFWALNNLRIWAEHTGIDETYRYQMSWWQKLLFLPHNVGYHYEHHTYSSVPFWNLPRVRRLDQTKPIIPTFGALIHSFAAGRTAEPIAAASNGGRT